jgi:hypothetical protein
VYFFFSSFIFFNNSKTKMLSLKLFNLVLNLALLGLLIAVLVKKDKKEKFNGDELAAPGAAPAPPMFAPSLNSDIKNLATTSSIKTLKTTVDDNFDTIRTQLPAINYAKTGLHPAFTFDANTGTNITDNVSKFGYLTTQLPALNLGKTGKRPNPFNLDSIGDNVTKFGYVKTQLPGLTLKSKPPPGQSFDLGQIGTNKDDVTDMGKIVDTANTRLNLGNWHLGANPGNPKLLNFGYKVGDNTYNPVFFRYDGTTAIPGTAQVWAQTINSPGYTADSGEWGKLRYKNAPLFPPPAT